MGWHVDIDEKTYYKYKAIKDPTLKVLIKKSLRQNEDMIAPDINFGKVKLTKAQNCAFLDTQRLCEIQKKYGETYLSNVCALFPRIVNRINGQLELSLSPACPEAIRQFLFMKEGISFTKGKAPFQVRLLTYDVNEKDKQYEKTPVKNLSKINRKCIDILKDRTLNFSQRLYRLGLFIETLQGSGGCKLTQLSRDSEENLVRLPESFLSPHHKRVMAFTNRIYETMAIEETVVSERYLAFFHKAQAFWSISKTDQKKAYDTYNDYFDQHAYVYENYFVNLAYRNIFPFTEADDLFDAYMLFVVRFVMIQRDLIGLAAQDELTKEAIEAYFQSYSKAIEHHHYFYSSLIETLRQNKMNSWAFIKELS
jgi:lysine-N-methylase